MNDFDELLTDTVFILKSDKSKSGPFKAAVSGATATIMDPALDVDDGDHLIRVISPAKEEKYLVISADYSSGMPPHIDPSYSLTLQKVNAFQAAQKTAKMTTVNIHGSTGIQVGDYNTQNIQITVTELIKKLDESDAPNEQKVEAKNKLREFLAHPLVTGVLGSAATALIGKIG